MTTQDIPLFKAIGAKMGYLDQRQRVISENIANADTPNYMPKDLTPVDFGKMLKTLTHSKGISLETTDNQHMVQGGTTQEAKEKNQKRVYEVAPVGNAVVMEEQLVNSNRTVIDYNLMISLYQKNMGMLKTAIGRNG